jgi:hypothetical protein
MNGRSLGSGVAVGMGEKEKVGLVAVAVIG